MNQIEKLFEIMIVHEMERLRKENEELKQLIEAGKKEINAHKSDCA